MDTRALGLAESIDDGFLNGNLEGRRLTYFEGRTEGPLTGFLVGFRGVGFLEGSRGLRSDGFAVTLDESFESGVTIVNMNEKLNPDDTMLEILIPVVFMPCMYA